MGDMRVYNSRRMFASPSSGLWLPISRYLVLGDLAFAYLLCLFGVLPSNSVVVVAKLPDGKLSEEGRKVLSDVAHSRNMEVFDQEDVRWGFSAKDVLPSHRSAYNLSGHYWFPRKLGLDDERLVAYTMAECACLRLWEQVSGNDCGPFYMKRPVLQSISSVISAAGADVCGWDGLEYPTGSSLSFEDARFLGEQVSFEERGDDPFISACTGVKRSLDTVCNIWENILMCEGGIAFPFEEKKLSAAGVVEAIEELVEKHDLKPMFDAAAAGVCAQDILA